MGTKSVLQRLLCRIGALPVQLLLLMFAFSSCDFASTSDVEDVKEEVVTLHGTILGLRSNISDIEVSLQTILSEVADLESDIRGLRTDIANVQTDIETLNGDPEEIQPIAQGETQLRILSPVAATRDILGNTATFTGEIENTGESDAVNVTIELRARSEAGAALGDVTVTVGTVRRGERKLFTVTFSDVDPFDFNSTYVTQADYEITYSDGDSIRLGGTGSIVVL